MNMNSPLVPGTIQSIYDSNSLKDPWVQIIHLKSFEKDNSSTARYKIVISDSKNFMQGTLATNLNHLVESKTIEVNSIIQLSKYAVNNIKNHRLVFIAEIKTDEVMKGFGRIGEPANIDNSATGSSAATTSAVSSAIPTQAPLAAPSTFSAPQAAKAAVSHANLTGNIQPIASLSPYKDRNEIRARVTSKTEIKKWTNEKGEGRLFSVSLLDGSGEIRLTCFNDSVDKYFDLLQVGSVYDIANFPVKIAKRQYGNIQNDYEISVDANTQITPVLEDASSIPTILYAFIPICKLADKNKDEVVDVIGVVQECGELTQITAKTTQKQLTKRDLTLVDTSAASIKVTLWGKQAEDFNEAQAATMPILAIKSARVNEYQGKTLSTMGTSLLTLNPDIAESHALRGWFDSQNGQKETFTNVSSASSASASKEASRDDRKFLSQIKDEGLGQNDKPDYFQTIASISYVKSDSGNISYMACLTEGCNKKVIEEGPNQYRCERCQKVFDRCDHRYILTLQISDSTGTTWVQAFNEHGAQILEKPAEEMYYLKMNNEAEYQQVIKACYFKTYHFRLRAKLESYQGESKTRCSIMSVQAIDFEKDSQSLIKRIEGHFN